MMEYPIRIFYRTGTRGSLKVSDAKVVEETDKKRVFHIRDGDIRAIRELEGEASLLEKDGNTVETNIDLIWEKDHYHELYIHGGRYCATEHTIWYNGDYDGKIKSEKAKKLRINDVIIYGDGDFSNDWEWEVIDEGESALVKQSDDLTNFFGSRCLYIGFEDEIDTLRLVRDII